MSWCYFQEISDAFRYAGNFHFVHAEMRVSLERMIEVLKEETKFVEEVHN